ncbi:hypothetical protein OD91_0467 [Lutibacter sp. Hel_I_33_5]|uniref:D-alanine--D-alanine ligase n=1 Tax=Lutibacter sp. Hel_I_33_5 TaxID=1566289 RepID=UPI0011A0B0D2|nr:D-alanine--D-alanine ligase [Lutibacter sp. Hel_I_33_5]TVZ55222.1 hypothetical protein OD91_0467 [Lutibacter sp. Hel_I_33_5]
MLNKKFHKTFNWEHWPSSMFYIPNLPYAFYLASKAKHSAFFSAANPSIKSSGNGTESKYKTIQLVPEKHRPKSILHNSDNDFLATYKAIQESNIDFPLIAKPDIGFRGLLVKKINTKEELEEYLKKYPVNILIQEFLEYENECGIFYHRNPNSKNGIISSITLKKFLTVTADGTSTLKELINNDSRAKLYLEILENLHKNDLEKVPSKNKKIKLSVIGNHSKGTQFICGKHLISNKLVETFNQLSYKIPGWFYGRIDLKYNSIEDLERGEDFKILEINGIISEPTHIYDAKNYNYFQALKAIRSHWKSLYEIATTNHKEHKVPYVSSKKFISEMFELRAYTKKVKKISTY